MLAAFYDAFDQELLQERQRAKGLCFQLNQTSPLDTVEQKRIVKDLPRVDDAWVESPFTSIMDYIYRWEATFMPIMATPFWIATL